MNIVWTMIKIAWFTGTVLILSEAAEARRKLRRTIPLIEEPLSIEAQLDIAIMTREISS